MIKKIVAWILLLLVCSSNAIAQNKVIDSLTAVVNNAPNDSIKFLRMINLSHNLEDVDTGKAWNYYREVKAMADKSGKFIQLGQAFELGGTLNTKHNSIKAIEYFEKAVFYLNKDSASLIAKQSIASIKNNVGIIHYMNSDFQGTLELFLEAINIYEKHDPKNSNLSSMYANAAILYSKLKNPNEAVRYSNRALVFASQSGKKQNILAANLGMANSILAGDSISKALPFIETGLAIAKELKNNYFTWSAYESLGLYYYKLKEYKKSALNYGNTLHILKVNGYTNNFAQTFISLAAAYSGANELNLAKSNLDSAKKYFDFNAISYEKQIYFETLAEIYQSEKNYKLGMQIKDSITLIKDSLYNQENIKVIEFVNARFQNAQKQSDIAKLENDKKLQQAQIKQKNTLNYLLGGGAAAIALLSFLAYRNYKHRKKVDQLRITELETEKQLFATEAVLKGEEQERTRLAKDLHDGLGGMLSGIKYSFNNMKENLILTTDTAQAFSRSMDMLDNSIKEMRRVAHNMMPESLLRYGLDKTLQDYTGEINKSGIVTVAYQSMGMENKKVDNTTAITIYRIVQELLNNVTKHAAAKQVLVQLLAQGNKLVVNVEDDGRGFDTEILESAEGIGWKNIKSRVEFLKGTLDVQSAHGKGTAVNMEFNI